MDIWKKLGLVLASSVVLAACGDTDEGQETDDDQEEIVEDPEEEPEEDEDDSDNGLIDDDDEDDEVDVDHWAENLEESTENLESYASDMYLDLEVSIGPDAMSDRDEDWLTMYIVGDYEQGYSISENEEGVTQELYFEGDDIYLVEEDGWNAYPDEGPVEYDSGYHNLVASLIEIEDLLEAEESGDDIELHYEGNDPEVWDAFEEEFSLSIDGIDEEDITILVEATIDGETYHLEELLIDIVGEDTDEEIEGEMGSVTMFIETEFYDHNEVDLSEIEEEIEEELEE